MPEIKKSQCDSCLFNFACDNVGKEDCTIVCLREDCPLYKVFKMGYDAGYNFGYMDCETEFEDSLNELKEGLDELEDDECTVEF